jgi:hypothetical protein
MAVSKADRVVEVRELLGADDESDEGDKAGKQKLLAK